MGIKKAHNLNLLEHLCSVLTFGTSKVQNTFVIPNFILDKFTAIKKHYLAFIVQTGAKKTYDLAK